MALVDRSAGKQGYPVLDPVLTGSTAFYAARLIHARARVRPEIAIALDTEERTAKSPQPLRVLLILLI